MYFFALPEMLKALYRWLYLNLTKLFFWSEELRLEIEYSYDKRQTSRIPFNKWMYPTKEGVAAVVRVFPERAEAVKKDYFWGCIRMMAFTLLILFLCGIAAYYRFGFVGVGLWLGLWALIEAAMWGMKKGRRRL